MIELVSICKIVKFCVFVNLKSFGSITLKIEEEEIEQVTSYKYLGVEINETLTWTDHVESIRKRVAQRLGLLQRIKHLLPQYSRELLVNSLILPLLDYADIVWGDKNNKSLMDNLQVLHNKAAKFVLNLPNRESSTRALTLLSWRPLSARRKIHRYAFVYRAIQSHKGKNPFNFPNLQGQDYHKYNTRGKLKFRLPSCKTNWGKNRSSYHFINEFNNLSLSINTNTTFSDFKSQLWNS